MMMMMMMKRSTMRVLPLALLLLSNALHVSSFSVGSVKTRVGSTALSSSTTVIDYEFIPPDKNDNQNAAASTSTSHKLKLPSTYPTDIPAGMRGEAVRSALRSGQCIGWRLTDTPLEFGVVSVKGQGCVNFLNNKLTQFFPTSFDDDMKGHNPTLFRPACLLTPKGRLVDRLGVALTEPDSAYMFTSPGHSSEALFQRLDPFIFPLDQVKLQNLCSSSSKDSSSSSPVFIFTLVSTKQEHLQSVFDKQILPMLDLSASTLAATKKEGKLPSSNQCWRIPLDANDSDYDSDTSSYLLIAPQTTLPECAATGYDFVFVQNTDDSDNNGVGARIWDYLVSDGNAQGPVEMGALELDTLRIEAGQAAYGHEITGHEKTPSETAATPLELHYGATGQHAYIDTTKGCYLGQEGIASVLKNARGPPRQMYSVIFEDDFNIYDGQEQEYDQQGSSNSKSNNGVDNLTRVPQPGDSLYVLGSNEEINIGSLRSIAEPGGTGQAVTLGLALVRRADSILKRMKSMDLQIPRRSSGASSRGTESSFDDGSGIIQPPPLDPLDGLEVIVGGTFTVGRLRMVASRRLRPGLNMFVDEDPSYISNREDDDDYDSDDGFLDVTRKPMTDGGKALIEADLAAQREAEEDVDDEEEEEEEDNDDEDEAEYTKAQEEAAKAQEEAATAESEAKRKVEKMEMLRKRAEDALAKRKQKKTE
jgi:folate-binding Fe-S cluster repair protein YgfZ